MKTFLALLLGTLLASTAALASTFKCTAPRSQPDAFLANSYVIVKTTSTDLRFQQFDDSSNNLMRDYTYKFKKIDQGRGRVKGMMMFVLEKEIQSYGDALYSLYFDKAISSGKAGAMIFNGQGFSWDWNYCKPVSQR